MTPDEFTDSILGAPIKWIDTMPPSNCTNPQVILGSLIPPDRYIDAETLDGRKFKIRVRYVAKLSEDTE